MHSSPVLYDGRIFRLFVGMDYYRTMASHTIISHHRYLRDPTKAFTSKPFILDSVHTHFICFEYNSSDDTSEIERHESQKQIVLHIILSWRVMPSLRFEIWNQFLSLFIIQRDTANLYSHKQPNTRRTNLCTRFKCTWITTDKLLLLFELLLLFVIDVCVIVPRLWDGRGHRRNACNRGVPIFRQLRF